ncbi:MAG: sulfatase-like hydrolase/transferase [Phycisphaeraceae bacterium]|nr:MAG: sulfatase-like hydrolase/transferase [Phycisphaeraceae bacterium]
MSRQAKVGLSPVGAVVLLLALAALGQRAASARPNILFIISDDAGWADFGFNALGNGEVPTPALDSIAARGVQFFAAYTSPVCSISRARTFLGQYPQRSGYQDNEPSSQDASDDVVQGLRLEDTTMFERLHDAGYHVGYFGKWHLGMEQDIVQDGVLVTPGNLPPRHGIDYFLGLLGGARPYSMGAATGFGDSLREQTLDPNTNLVVDIDREGDWPAGDYVTDVLAESVANHITDWYDQPQPFFVVASFTAPHSPLQSTQNYLDMIDAATPGLTGDRRIYAAMLLAMDVGVQTILDRLADPNQDGDQSDSIVDNTLICFMNDNGGQTLHGAVNDPLRGKKGETFDGGIRVPMLVAGPGVPDSGLVFDDPVDSVDLMPTFLNAAGAPLGPDDATDGVDLLPYLNGELTGPPHAHIYVRAGGVQNIGVRRDQWKLTTNYDSGPLLFDIIAHIEERGRYDDDYPWLVEELRDIMYSYEAVFPKPRWGSEVYNTFDAFKYRPDVAGSAVWSAPSAWSEVGQTTPATMYYRDGFADLTVRFPTSPTPYTATNDFARPNGVMMLIGSVDFYGDHSSAADSSASIPGLPLLFVNTLAGEPPHIRVDATHSGAGLHPFEFGAPIVLWDDLFLDGAGAEMLTISGGLEERRVGRNLTKAGAWPLVLASPVHLSGVLHLQDGSTTVSTGGLLDVAAVQVDHSASLTLTAGLPDGEGFLADDAAVSIDTAGAGPSINLDYSGADRIGSLVIDGFVQPAGLYSAQTNPDAIAGNGVIQVTGPAACGPADLADPFGVLDLADVSAFVSAFVAQSPAADLDGSGVLDLSDITAFVFAFRSGCP